MTQSTEIEGRIEPLRTENVPLACLMCLSICMAVLPALAEDPCTEALGLVRQADSGLNASNAEALYFRAITLCPKVPQTHLRLATVQQESGRPRDAIMTLEQAAASNDSAPLRQNLGRLWLDSGDPRKAVTELEQGHALDRSYDNRQLTRPEQVHSEARTSAGAV